MCKIFACIGFEDKELLWKLVGTAAPLISRYNPHSFGFACYSEQSKKIWTEKFLVPEDAWDTEKFKERRDTKEFRKTGKRTSRDTTPTVLSHARWATSAKIIANAHPFVRGNSALIHNGTVSYSGLKFLQGSCDSEGILNAYFDLNISHNPDNFPYLLGLLNGSYACCVLSKVNDTHCVDVFKNGSTSLAKITVDGERGFILSTAQLDAERVVKYVEKKVQKYEAFEADTLVRYCATTGEKILERKFEKAPQYYHFSDKYLGNATDDVMVNNFTSGRDDYHPTGDDRWERSHSSTKSSSSATHIKKNKCSIIATSQGKGQNSKRTYIEEELEIGSIHELINNNLKPDRIKTADALLL